MHACSQKTVTLVLGGARSGKSRYAQQLAAGGQRVAFLATAEASDDEMRQRIARHRAERPPAWSTVEVPLDLEAAVLECGESFDLLLIDCLTLWTANLLASERGDAQRILARAARLCHALHRTPAGVVLVSNEVGEGIVPDNAVARAYRDLLGEINQRVAKAADVVLLMVAGYPITVKTRVEDVALKTSLPQSTQRTQR
jgi:adenosylcobinamide kinase/adenosylcobinamide-phosphate guanylyltransferase